MHLSAAAGEPADQMVADEAARTSDQNPLSGLFCGDSGVHQSGVPQASVIRTGASGVVTALNAIKQ